MFRVRHLSWRAGLAGGLLCLSLTLQAGEAGLADYLRLAGESLVRLEAGYVAAPEALAKEQRRLLAVARGAVLDRLRQAPDEGLSMLLLRLDGLAQQGPRRLEARWRELLPRSEEGRRWAAVLHGPLYARSCLRRYRRTRDAAWLAAARRALAQGREAARALRETALAGR